MSAVINFQAAVNARRVAAATALARAAEATATAARRAEIVETFKTTGAAGELFGHIIADAEQASREREAATKFRPAYCDPANEMKGAKYEATRALSSTDIARRMRADIKEAIATGTLPKGVKTSIRTRYFSGGSAIDLRITAIPADVQLLATDRLRWERDNPHAPYHHCPYRDTYTPEAQAILDRLKAIHTSYNRDNSDSSSDYFDVNFYGQAEFDWQLRRDATAAQLAALDS